MDEKFKINSDFYDKDLVKFVDWFLEQMAKGQGEGRRMIAKSMKPFILNYSHNLLVFIMSIDGDFNRINEIIVKTPEEFGIRPVIERKHE